MNVDAYFIVALLISATPTALMHVVVRKTKSMMKWVIAGVLVMVPIGTVIFVSPDLGILLALAEFGVVYYLSNKNAPETKVKDDRPELWNERIKRVHAHLPEDKKAREGIEFELMKRLESEGKNPSVEGVIRMLTDLYGSEVRVYEKTIMKEVMELVASHKKHGGI